MVVARRLLAPLLTALVMWFGVAVAGAQDDVIQVLSVDSSAQPTVELVVAIPPGYGEVPGSSDFFAITESGGRRTVSVQSLTDQVDVVLLIDTSGSMNANGALEAAKVAAGEFIEELPEGARVSVVGFGAEPVVASSMSTDDALHLAAIAELSAAGETALWDALMLSAQVLEESGADQPYVVVLSDGGDTVSQATREDAVAALVDQAAPLYAVALATAESDEVGLVQTIDEVGGEFLRASETSELSGLYLEIAGRLSSRYRLSFEAEGSGDTEVVVSVAVDGAVALARADLNLDERSSGSPLVPSSLNSAPVAAELGLVVGPPPGPLAQPWLLWAGAAGMFAALALVISQFSSPSLEVRSIGSRVGQTGSRVSEIRDGLTRGADQLVARGDSEQSFDTTLDAAGINLRAGEFLVLTGACVVAASLVGSVTAGSVGALVLGLVAALVALALVQIKVGRRRAAFSDQLGDTITIMIGALRSGRGFPQAMELVSQEAPSPTSDEFRRVVVESRVGRDQVQSLEAVAARMENTDVEWIAQAVAINRELGGDLIEVLENVGETIRARTRVHRQVRALSAEGRISGWFMVAMPFVMFAYMRAVNPEYVDPLTSTTGGLAALGFGLVLIATGSLWIRKLIDLKY